MTLEISQYNRPIAWLAEWQLYGGKAYGSCLFSTRGEAIKYAISHALGYVDWSAFPDPAKKYPDDDRDGFHVPELTPAFRATWSNDGGGSVQVTKTEIEDRFQAAQYLVDQTQAVFDNLPQKSYGTIRVVI